MRTRPRPLVAVAAVALVLASSSSATGASGDPDDPVIDWAERRGHTLTGTDPGLPARDLRPLGRSVGSAQVVGLGEAAHRLEEITELKHRTLRYLVEQRGFRSIAWEDDWSLGTRINDYVLGRRDDRDALIAQLSDAWRTREVADVLTWLRRYNATHRDKVRFTGVEYFATRPLTYHAVERYVARHAPRLLPAVRAHLGLIEPPDDDMGAYLRWYRFDVADKTPYVRRSARLRDLVAGIPHRAGDRAHALALHHATQIRSFYAAFALPDADIPAFRDARAAENLRWWRRHSGDKVVYWAATAHTADAPDLAITAPPYPDVTFASVGSYLADWYGERYLSIGFTFGRGTYEVTPDTVAPLRPPAADWFERPLTGVRDRQFVLDLRRSAPRPVDEWLSAPMLTRGYPELPDSTARGGTSGQWFDVVVHRQVVSPATPLGTGIDEERR